MPADKMLFLVRSRKRDFSLSAIRVECVTTNPRLARIAALFVCSHDRDHELAEVWITQHANGEQCGCLDAGGQRVNEVYRAEKVGTRTDPKNPMRWQEKVFHGFGIHAPLRQLRPSEVRAADGMFRVVAYLESRPYQFGDDVETLEELETLLSYREPYARFFAVNDLGETVDPRTGLPGHATAELMSSR